MRHKWKYFGIFAASVLLTLSDAYAQMAWVKNGKPVSRILVANPDSANHQAALLLQDFIERISGASLPILESAQGKKGDILIGKGDTSGLTEDGFRLKTDNQTLEISSGGDKGAIYGVVTLLEDYLGVECYTSHVYNFQKRKDIVIPEINRFENPSFRYRQTQSYAIQEDPVYKMWFRLEEPKEVFAGNLWVHTFDKILPASEFGESWVGWEGKSASFIIDLGKEADIHTIETDFLHQLGQWVFLPKKVSYSTSADNEQYTTFGTTEIAEDRSIEVKFSQVRSDKPEGIKARYVKVDVDGINICPPWHPGVGNKAWFFMDEVRVF